MLSTARRQVIISSNTEGLARRYDTNCYNVAVSDTALIVEPFAALQLWNVKRTNNLQALALSVI